MAHKFDGRWHCFLVFGNGPQAKGYMNLHVKPSGELDPSDHEDPAGTHTKIVKGLALGLGPLYQLTLENEYGDRYEGMLAHESADGTKFVIAGKKSYGSDKRRLAETKDQDDPPWIITKP